MAPSIAERGQQWRESLQMVGRAHVHEPVSMIPATARIGAFSALGGNSRVVHL
jgi:hypothetical protein